MEELWATLRSINGARLYWAAIDDARGWTLIQTDSEMQPVAAYRQHERAAAAKRRKWLDLSRVEQVMLQFTLIQTLPD